MRVSSICHIIILSYKCQLFFLQRLSITQYTAFKTGALKTGDVATCEKLMNLNSPEKRILSSLTVLLPSFQSSAWPE